MAGGRSRGNIGIPEGARQQLWTVPVLSAGAVGLVAGLLPFGTVVMLFSVVVGAIGIVSGPAVRVGTVVAGGLIVLQSSQEVTATKIGYAVVVMAAAGLSAQSLLSAGRGARQMLRQLAWPIGVLGALVVISLVVAQLHGTPLALWLRDVTPYALVAVSPLFALDLAVHVRTGVVVRMLALFALAGAGSFALEWVGRRGFVEGSSGVLASSFLGAGGFAYAVAATSLIPSMRWAAYGTGLFLVMLSTGTRSSLAWLAAVGVVAVHVTRRGIASFALARQGTRVLRHGISGAVVAVTTVALTGLWVPLPIDTAVARLASVGSLGGGGDPSFLDRQVQTQTALDVFRENPVFGAGPGVTFEWVRPWVYPIGSGLERSTSMDTSLTFLAEFGTLGIVVLATIIGWAVSSSGRDVIDWNGLGGLALKAFGAIALVSLPLGDPMTDKGFGLVLTMLLALGMRVSSRLDCGAGALREAEFRLERGRHVV